MPGRVARLALATATLGSALLLTPPASADTPAGPAAVPSSAAAGSGEPLQVTLDGVSPAVVTDGSPVTVTATVRNGGSARLSGISAVVRQDASTLGNRAAVQTWATTNTAATGSVLARTTVKQPLGPGQQTQVTFKVTDVGSGRAATYGAVPVSVEVESGSTAGRLHTFLGYQRMKEYVPIRLALAVPLVLDADPRLSGTGTARQGAWLASVGPGSRLERIVAATENLPVGWILDPSLTRTSQAPVATTPSTTTTSPSTPPTTTRTPDRYAATTAEAQARVAFADRIRQSEAGHDPLILPVGDPDVAGAAQDGRLVDAARHALAESTADSGGVGLPGGVAWPAAGQWSAAVEAATRAAYGTGLKGALVDNAWLAGRSDNTAVSEQRTASGLPLVAYDHTLSDLLARAGVPAQSTLAIQEMVADTVTLVKERPGTERSAAAVGARDMDPDPASLRRLLTTLAIVPWVQQDTIPAQLARAAASDDPPAVLATKPPRTPGPLMARVGAAYLFADLQSIRAMAGVRRDADAFAPPWQQAGAGLLATSWRAHRQGWSLLRKELKTAATGVASGLYVAPRQINFLADSGRVQITVVNDLNVPVHDVRLTLAPDNPRLRIDDPAVVLRIGAKSRSTVTFRATALAAGSVPVTTTLTAPDGTVIRTEAPVRISVTPTGDWMYWALGSVAGTILVVGIWRGLRRGRAPVAAVPASDRVPS